jgi:thiol-disulfide isomerase/thioredoxin
MQKAFRLMIFCSLFLFFICVHLSCKDAPKKEAPDYVTDKIELNEEVTIDEEIMLKGLSDRMGFQLPTYKHWFDSTYEAHPLDVAILDQIKPLVSDMSFDVYLGTWCSDSRREVPAFYRIMDHLAIAEDQVHQVCVDRSKEVPKDLMTIDSLEFVPTIVVYKNEKEVGRIIEFPNNTLEKDIVDMVMK